MTDNYITIHLLDHDGRYEIQVSLHLITVKTYRSVAQNLYSCKETLQITPKLCIALNN
jgi:hypothetical protein